MQAHDTDLMQIIYKKDDGRIQLLFIIEINNEDLKRERRAG